ncbi:MAG: lipase secretion chaperone [Pedobacter sp.]|nr:lipase secretion chaperone [Pedobacter sp.]
MNKKILMMLGVFFLLVTAGGVSWWLHDSSGVGGVQQASALPLSSGVSADSHSPAAIATGLEGLPQSLAGTEVDCSLETDTAGHLRVTIGLRHCFDYFLSAVGEESIDALARRIHAQLRNRLQQPALGEAERVLAGYLAYLRGVADIEKRLLPPEAGQLDMERARQQMEQVRALRRLYLSPEVIVVFFSDDDAYGRYALERLELMQNKQLSAQARAQQLAALEQQLPEDIKASLRTVNQYLDLRELTDEWKKRSGSVEELRQIRSSLVGAEATARLEALDQENSAWDKRMSDWYSQRDAVLKNTALSQGDRERNLEDLRKMNFANEAERMRVAALERIHDQGLAVSGP